jgi:hypothetical protein
MGRISRWGEAKLVNLETGTIGEILEYAVDGESVSDVIRLGLKREMVRRGSRKAKDWHVHGHGDYTAEAEKRALRAADAIKHK